MRRLIATLVFTVLAATLALARPAQDRDDRRDRDDRHDHGKHKGWDKHGDEGERHDNGKRKGWDNPNKLITKIAMRTTIAFLRAALTPTAATNT